ncbi:type II toxin-antitoxin system PemK/MazF family toxin [Pseudoflavonifractor phocaeensis]|nr:type II toxin-antitoxin system PemK/MazF family toxin [Pseudoflavonifractor phocaeensis]
MKTYYRGDIYYADLRPVVGSEQGGIRPVVILQNNVGNRYSPTMLSSSALADLRRTRLLQNSSHSSGNAASIPTATGECGCG